MTAQVDPEQKYSVLTPGDAVAPCLMYGVHSIELPTPGALPGKWTATPEDVFVRSRQEDLPAWIDDMPLHVVLLVQQVLSDVQAIDINDDTPHAFDLYHRLDDMTLVGRVRRDSKQVPVMALQFKPTALADASGKELTKQFNLLRRRDITVRKTFAIEARDVSKLPKSLWEIEPRIVLEETYRLSSVYVGTNVGAAAGSTSLMPGETRTIEISSDRKTTSKRTQKASAVEKVTTSSKREFKSQFDRTEKKTSGYKSSFAWTGTDKSDTGSSTTNKSWSRDVEKVVEDTRSTVETITTDRTRENQISLSEEYEHSDETTSKSSRKVTLKNESNQVVTYVYHHLNDTYRVNLDLIRVRLYFAGTGPKDPPVHIDFDGNVKARLPESVKDGHWTAVSKTIVDAFKNRYAKYKFADVTASSISLKRSDADDVNTRIHSRSALTGARRTTGPLPVNMDSWDIVIQTSGLHPVPHLSEFATPKAGTVVLAAPAPAAAKPQQAAETQVSKKQASKKKASKKQASKKNASKKQASKKQASKKQASKKKASKKKASKKSKRAKK